MNTPDLLTVDNLAVHFRQNEKEIQAAIEGLPETFKVPFRLYFEGYKYQEIAEYLQEPLGTIKSRIHFARKLLKSQIQRF